MKMLKKGSIVFTGKIKIIYPQRGLHLDFFLLNEKKKKSEKKNKITIETEKNTQFFPLLEFLAHLSN